MGITTAPADLTATQELLEALMRDSMRIDTFTPTDMGGNFWALVSRYSDGTWVLNEDWILTWYPGGTFDEDGYEADFSVQIDATTPRHIAAAAHNIITAPADQRAYVAAVEGPNVAPAPAPAPAEAPVKNSLIIGSARSRGWDRGHTAATAGGDRDALAEETATNLYPDVPQLHRECADAFRLAWDARLSQ